MRVPTYLALRHLVPFKGQLGGWDAGSLKVITEHSQIFEDCFSGFDASELTLPQEIPQFDGISLRQGDCPCYGLLRPPCSNLQPSPGPRSKKVPLVNQLEDLDACFSVKVKDHKVNASLMTSQLGQICSSVTNGHNHPDVITRSMWRHIHRLRSDTIAQSSACLFTDLEVPGGGARMLSTESWRGTAITAWVLLVQALRQAGVEGHGRLMDPPSRNSMWRFGFPNPVNYNDNELFCGGYAVQWEQNQGRCGVCGDPFHFIDPRPHEAGGQYAKGIIGRHYTSGQEIDVEVELTANHWGRFEMYLCPNNNPREEATQSCFDRFPLYLSGSKDVGFQIPLETKKKAVFRYKVRLPPYVTCSQCVVQWTYFTGNMWGTCANGTEAVGCGRPETFRNCADITIVTSTSGLPPQFAGFQDNPFMLFYRDFRSNLVAPLVIRSQVCLPTPFYKRLPGMDQWCQENCLRYPPNCNPMLCQCPEVCDAIGELQGREGADVYCQDQCIIYPSRCPVDKYPEVPGSILGAYRFPVNQFVWDGIKLSPVRTNEEILDYINSSSGLEN
uniref:Chitin-binding type-4 domain-containing protein n=1 Tax=Timema tahoe TaxID=61484 RepID=A0A7R9NUC2_9NEOP|nr:unnamed protein product [Timema tahoe]